MSLVLATNMPDYLPIVCQAISVHRFTVCTQYQFRIVGGAITTIDRYPIVAQLLLDVRGRREFNQHCAGVILTSRHVISCAHCYQYSAGTGLNYTLPKYWKIRVGSSFRSQGGVLHKVKTIIIHRDFNKYYYTNDIAVLVVSRPFTFGPGVRQGTIAKLGNEIRRNSSCTVIGWGAAESTVMLSEQLRYATVYTVDHRLCVYRYNNIMAKISDSMLCAGHLDVGGIDGCFGDSGGPLLYKGVVVGLVSFGFACGHAYYPGVYTKTSSYTDWILQTIATYK
ncbi:trypsin, alkaline A-like [Cydia strobilella]|uniref:trypsin, alkaline A-like n=1 Tax=Cydia strobilella TaxID=1100964 RepID=UPI0030061825